MKINILCRKATIKSLFEHYDGTYCKQCDYLIPNLTLPNIEENDIVIYGQEHLKYLQEYRNLTYINLLTIVVLNTYLFEINKQAQVRFFRL